MPERFKNFGEEYIYDIDLWNTCNTFKTGHRVRLQLASQASPKYDRNPQTGAELGRTTELKPSEQRIYHDAQHPSHIVLPVVPKQ